MKNCLLLVLFLAIITSCQVSEESRIIEDFNKGWKFEKNLKADAFSPDFDDSGWSNVNLPHDWSIEDGYKQGNTSSSTGFVEGGIAWYRKTFSIDQADREKVFSIEFDGIYNNSEVWINGHYLGERPYGYSGFAYNLTKHLNFDEGENVIAVKVDRTKYADSRWYTGSGIYRNVRLVKTNPIYVRKDGVLITSNVLENGDAEVNIKTHLVNETSEEPKVTLKVSVYSSEGEIVAHGSGEITISGNTSSSLSLTIENPKLWDIGSPNLYGAKVEVIKDGKPIDSYKTKFGIRTIKFDANKGFFLNGRSVKIKGVNLHHDAGCLGAAVPKDVWEYRVKKLKSIGVNSIRMSHNPHSVELMEVCDEQGMLAMSEIFDEWDRPKGKNKDYIGDKAASEEISTGYPNDFNEWAERDLKDWVARDFNHPSVIMWSIGNEIELSFPYYHGAYDLVNGDQDYYEVEPSYDSIKIAKAFDKLTGGVDTLALIAAKLSKWVKEVDTSRPVTCGSHQPSIALISGYADAVDVLGFNYRGNEYEIAHKTYPDLKIIGSENWVNYSEWDSIKNRDYVAGIYLWTGFAYLGEAGPWPRKGLNISLFDFSGLKNPSGHFFECLWKDDPKVYMVTTPAKESEYSYNAQTGWKFTRQYTPAPAWDLLRLWEWYKTYPKWNYPKGEEIVVQAYTNCEEAELFFNGNSLGKQALADFADDNIIKWLVPYSDGELKIVGYNNGEAVSKYELHSEGKLAEIKIESTKEVLIADGYSVAVVSLSLLDENGRLITDNDAEIKFDYSGPVKNIGIDNGWEYNVSSHKSNSVKTHQGRAVIFLQSTKEAGVASVTAYSEELSSNNIEISIKN